MMMMSQIALTNNFKLMCQLLIVANVMLFTWLLKMVM